MELPSPLPILRPGTLARQTTPAAAAFGRRLQVQVVTLPPLVITQVLRWPPVKSAPGPLLLGIPSRPVVVEVSLLRIMQLARQGGRPVGKSTATAQIATTIHKGILSTGSVP